MGIAVVGVTLLDVLAGGWPRRRRAAPFMRLFGRRSVLVRKSITVNRSPEEAYRCWRDLEQLPRFLSHLDSVQVIDAMRSRWVGWGPAGTHMEWEAELIEDRPGERLAWRSSGGVFDHTTRIKFLRTPGNRGTEVCVEVGFHAPRGPLGARLFGEVPGELVKANLHRFKQLVELGEVVHSDASIHRGPHSAQPSPREM